MQDIASGRSGTDDSRRKIVRLLALCLTLGALYGLARPMLSWLRFVFNEPGEDMGHGWLVPLFSIYLLWTRRKRLWESIGNPSWAGVGLCLPLLALLWLGERGDQVRLSQIAIYGLLWTTPYAVLGRRFAAQIFFPVVFLVFTVPIGFLDFFTVRLRLFTSAASAALLNGVGIPVVRVGTGLQCLGGDGFALDVADPCSGLRSIFAMAALTAGYAHLTQRTLWRKWLLFACALPLAVLGNMVRIFSIALVARLFGQEIATGFYHDYSGYLVFIVGTLLMVQAGNWIAHLGGRRWAAEDEGIPEAGGAAVPEVPAVAEAGDRAGVRDNAPAQGSPAERRQLAWAGAAGLLALMAAMSWSLHNMPTPVLEPQDFLVTEVTNLPGFRVTRPWFCQNEQCRRVIENQASDAAGRPAACPDCGGVLDEVSLGERTVLPGDTLFMKGNYQSARGDLYRVSVVINGASRQSIHRPELCLPAQGLAIEQTRHTALRLADGEDIPVKTVDLRRGGPGGRNLEMGQAYFFVSAHHRTSSHLMRMLISIRDRALFNRVTRWAMVVIVGEQPFDTPERRSSLEAFVNVFFPALLGRPATVTEMSNPRQEKKI